MAETPRGPVLDVPALLRAGEGPHLEFKRQLDRRGELAKDIVCFANSDGGLILFGVDDAHVVGVDDVDRLTLAIADVAHQRCRPPVTVIAETIEAGGASVVAVRVPQGQARPYSTADGRYYVRSGSRCRATSQEDLRRLFQAAGSLTYDETALAGTSTDDLELPAARRYIDEFARGETPQDDVGILRQLRNWRLLSHDAPTVAGMLLFGRTPQAIMAHAYVALARLDGTDIGADPTDRQNALGNLFDQIDDMQRFLRIHLRSPRVIEGFEREDREELPLTAVRELVINAVAHRDYVVSGPVRILVFDDRVEVRSPGAPPNNIDVDAMRSGVHVLRNPHVYTRLYAAGLVTDLGSGVPRAIARIRSSVGRDVAIRITEHETQFTIPRPAVDSQ